MAISPERIRWNSRYSDNSFLPNWGPDISLAQRMGELPKGRCLDFACGPGANSLFLAKRGYVVDALDFSDVAIEMLRRASYGEGVSDKVNLLLGDLKEHPLEVENYDLVVSFWFPLGGLMPRIVEALKPEGVLLHKVHTLHQQRYDPKCDRTLCVAPNELQTMAEGLETLHYEEVDERDNAHALLIARKPPQ